MLRAFAVCILLTGCTSHLTPQESARLAADIMGDYKPPQAPTVICDTRHGRVECPR
jgi:hypothetical protein